MKPLAVMLLMLCALNLRAQEPNDTIYIQGLKFKVLAGKNQAKKYPHKLLVSGSMVYLDTPFNDTTGTTIVSMSFSMSRNGTVFCDFSEVFAPLVQPHIMRYIAMAKPGDKVSFSTVKISTNRQKNMTGLVRPLVLECI